MSRIFSQDEVDYILSFMDKSTDYCQSKEDYQFDEAIRKKLDTLKSEPTTSYLVDELRKREGGRHKGNQRTKDKRNNRCN